MEQQPAKDDIMVSFDVVSLFTQVPVEEALTIIQTKYKLPEHIVELTNHCFSNAYFTYEGQRYKQVQGEPMGSPSHWYSLDLLVSSPSISFYGGSRRKSHNDRKTQAKNVDPICR